MGTSDILFDARVGDCSVCGTQYVTWAYIHLDDSHSNREDTYACPKCGENYPTNIKQTDDNRKLRQFANNQLERMLTWKEPTGVKLLTSELK